ncbi:MAG: DedA family protein [Devosia nanyangense]|uniref:DedA family protein n=1 Tax=Devosia nanyangense TaxID=1228055 RepID=A0A933L7J7_9HYPH|nr:DedA family protein [Devosia nanyangense]
MLDWLHQFSDYLSYILESISNNFWLSELFIFLVCIGEAVFIAGLLVPSLPILLLTGGLIAQGALPFWPIYFAAVAGAVIGDAISYGIGHLLKDRIKTVWPFRNYLPLIERGEEYFHKHGAAAIFIGRFITGVKAVIPGIAGMLGMPWGRFTLINIISAFVWAAAHILPGMLLTNWLDSMGLSLELVIIVGAIVLTILVGVIHYWKRIILLFTPFLGEFGRSLEARWRKPKTEPGH